MYAIASAGTEEMWILTDGTVYLFYTGPADVGSQRWSIIVS